MKTNLKESEINSRKTTSITIHLTRKDCQSKIPINFKEIITTNEEQLLLWCLKVGLITKPQRCNECKQSFGKVSSVRLERRETCLDKFVWRCSYKECKSIRNIRTGNKLLEMYSKLKLRIILIYIFTQYCFLVPAVTSHQSLNIRYKTIKSLSD